ncbi:hypothetical protein GW17_00046802 [Ensete ventricosum]|nr:hypothetical protein GW17_00046802 [Ensete ventricosum]
MQATSPILMTTLRVSGPTSGECVSTNQFSTCNALLASLPPLGHLCPRCLPLRSLLHSRPS